MTSLTAINSRVNRRFRRLTLNTVITLYCLIIAGGVVRSTGAGMGCPDWPKCFGSWIPPTEVSQLPLDYKEIYGAKLKGEIEFNPVKTWIEYVNRLLGAFTGVMIFITLIAATPYLKTEKRSIFYFSLTAFILVGLQGWLGAKVVSTELMPVMITLHMFLAIVIVFILLYLFTWASAENLVLKNAEQENRLINNIALVALSLSLVQILLGTQVRETMDEVIKLLGYEGRSEWVGALGTKFYVHRSFSILLTVVNVFWFFRVMKDIKAQAVVRRLVTWCLIVVVGELVTGIIMAYLEVPAYAQPMHLTLAILLIGLQFVVWLLINQKRYLGRGEIGVVE